MWSATGTYPLSNTMVFTDLELERRSSERVLSTSKRVTYYPRDSVAAVLFRSGTSLENPRSFPNGSSYRRTSADRQRGTSIVGTGNRSDWALDGYRYRGRHSTMNSSKIQQPYPKPRSQSLPAGKLVTFRPRLYSIQEEREEDVRAVDEGSVDTELKHQRRGIRKLSFGLKSMLKRKSSVSGVDESGRKEAKKDKEAPVSFTSEESAKHNQHPMISRFFGAMKCRI